MKGREDVERKTSNAVGNLLLKKKRGGRTDEEEEGEEKEAEREERKGWLNRGREIYREPAVQAPISTHRVFCDPIIQHVRDYGEIALNRRSEMTFTQPRVFI